MCANDSYKQKCVMNYYKVYVDGACDARIGANYNMLVTDKQHKVIKVKIIFYQEFSTINNKIIKPGTEGNAVTSSGTHCYCTVFCH